MFGVMNVLFLGGPMHSEYQSITSPKDIFNVHMVHVGTMVYRYRAIDTAYIYTDFIPEKKEGQEETERLAHSGARSQRGVD